MKEVCIHVMYVCIINKIIFHVSVNSSISKSN